VDVPSNVVFCPQWSQVVGHFTRVGHPENLAVFKLLQLLHLCEIARTDKKALASDRPMQDERISSQFLQPLLPVDVNVVKVLVRRVVQDPEHQPRFKRQETTSLERVVAAGRSVALYS